MAKVSLRAYNREIETMIDRGHLDEAVAHCRHILKTFPKHIDTYRLLGKTFLEGKHYGDAVDIFSRVLVSVPNDFVSQVGMSIIRDEENKLDDAIWHMERAFETQPSNAAIQSELQRLYARRDGVQPARIRMTRGALAHMYVQGELYPQAISEIKNVLKEDPGRSDMQALLARACYRSGLKNEAADVASALLRRYPYCLDANRVLVEILGADRPENAQVYRQRVIELDPYSAHVIGTIFLTSEVSDAAVNVERLDWNGQPVGMGTDWETKQAISLDSAKKQEEQPDWLATAYADTEPPAPFDQTRARPVPAFEPSAPPAGFARPAEPAEEIPEFLRAAGWSPSTGAFDESKPIFGIEESVPPAQPIEQGELPDWVKAMAPPEVTQASQPAAAEEELPDWIQNIGTGALGASSASTPGGEPEPDWMSQLDQSASTSPLGQPPESEAQPDWLNQLGQPEAATPPASTEQPDWLKGFGAESEPAASAAPSEELDWLSQLAEQSDSMSAEAPTTIETGVLNQPESQPEPAPSATSSDDFDFLNELTEEPLQPASPEPTSSAIDTSQLGTSEQERDDSFAWLESLAAKQGASEGLLTKPEERLEQEPEWIKQAKNLSEQPAQPPVQTPPPVLEPSANLEELGKSEKEQDDSFAWLENLAARQGASEGLLTKPEERLEQEPEWIKQAKDLSATTLQTSEPAEEVITPEPSTHAQLSSADDTAAWLKSLDEPVTTPEPASAHDETAMWLKCLDELEATPPKSVQPVQSDELPAWMQNIEEEKASEQEPVISASEIAAQTPEKEAEEESGWTPPAAGLFEQSFVSAEESPKAETESIPNWLGSLDQEETPAATQATAEEESAWKSPVEEPVEQSFVAAQETSKAETEGIPDWLGSLDQEETQTPTQAVAEEESAWMPPIEEPVEQPVVSAQETSKAEAESIPEWLSSLDQEEEKVSPLTAADQGLPAWLRDETGEVVAEPLKIEPTRADEWQPVEEKEAAPPELEPAPVLDSQPVEIEPEETAAPPPSVEIPELQPEPEPVQPVEIKPATPPEPYKEPVTRKSAGVLALPGDALLKQARNDLSGSNIPGALETYARLIKKGRFLEDVIHDLRDALYRYPVDVSIWQSLGDAYMRSNRLQDALDAYTKAEELLR